MAIPTLISWQLTQTTPEQLLYEKEQCELLRDQNNNGWLYYHNQYTENKNKYNQLPSAGHTEDRALLIEKIKEAKEKCKLYKKNDDEITRRLTRVNTELAILNHQVVPAVPIHFAAFR